MLDERGFLEAPGFVLLLLLSTLLMVQAYTLNQRRLQTREHHKQLLCLKETMGITQQLVKRVDALNQMLAAGTVGEAIAIFFPGAGWIMALNWEKAKKAIKTLQETAWFQAERELLQQLTRGCHVPLNALKTPFRHKLSFERNVDITLLRTQSETWKIHTPLVQYTVTWKLSNALELSPKWEVR